MKISDDLIRIYDDIFRYGDCGNDSMIRKRVILFSLENDDSMEPKIVAEFRQQYSCQKIMFDENNEEFYAHIDGYETEYDQHILHEIYWQIVNIIGDKMKYFVEFNVK